jgi:hypothetical protein
VMHYTFLTDVIFENALRGSRQARANTVIVEAALGDISEWDCSQLCRLVNPIDDGASFSVLNEWHVAQLPTFACVKDDTWCASLLNDAIDLLSSSSFIKRIVQNDMKGLSVYSLMHSWARDCQNGDMRKDSWLVAGCIVALAAPGFPLHTGAENSIQSHVQS